LLYLSSRLHLKFFTKDKYFTLSLRFDINDYWIFKLEGHLMDGLADVTYNPADPDPDPDWMLFAAKVSYSF
jgi:hypothetical protein